MITALKRYHYRMAALDKRQSLSPSSRTLAHLFVLAGDVFSHAAGKGLRRVIVTGE